MGGSGRHGGLRRGADVALLGEAAVAAVVAAPALGPRRAPDGGGGRVAEHLDA